MKWKKICIVMSTYNDYFTSQMLSELRDEYEHKNLKGIMLDIIKVPGAFEIPVTISKLGHYLRSV